MPNHRLTHVEMFDLRKLKDQGRGNVRLLVRGLAEIELPRLAVVVSEALRPDATLLPCFGYRSATKALYGRFARRVCRQRVGLIGNPARRSFHLHMAVALLVGEGAFGGVHGNLVEVGRA